MSTNANASVERPVYEIRVAGHLGDRWADWVDDLSLTREADGTTTMRAPLADQPALHGVLARMRDLGVPVISVCPSVDAETPRDGLMKAVVQRRYGTADELRIERTERPAVGEHDVLVRVRAAGLDAGVWHLMTGLPYIVRAGYGLRRPKHLVPGMDLAGRVEAVGSAVTRFQPGDDVFGSATGALAEYAAIPEDKLAPKPSNLGWEAAAAIGNSAAAALQALRDLANVQRGQRVLVIGASGGVGSFAVQIATALGAEVTGVASTSKLDLVRSMGAVDVIDYTREEIDARGTTYDAILDIGGNRPIRLLRRVLALEGTLVIVGGEGGGNWFGGVDRQIRAQVLSMFVRQQMRFLVSSVRASDLEVLARLAREGQLTPALDRTFGLDETPDAVRYLESGRARGKVVVTV
ncbi:MAG: NAD(P)-dependent alcohol dehydrogenase [Dehalococcoidia bacterium]